MNYDEQTIFYLLTEADASRLHSLAAALSRAVDDLLTARRQSIDHQDYAHNEMSAHEGAYEISIIANKEAKPDGKL